jgi:hypothetical protein
MENITNTIPHKTVVMETIHTTRFPPHAHKYDCILTKEKFDDIGI